MTFKDRKISTKQRVSLYSWPKIQMLTTEFSTSGTFLQTINLQHLL